MIKINGILKGVTLKSKVGDDNRTEHSISFSLELVEGVDRVQEIVEQLKQIVQIDIIPVQPKLR